MGWGGTDCLVVRPPVVLAIETAGFYGSLALVTRDYCIAEYTLGSRLTHSRRLLAGRDWLLRESGMDFAKIAALAMSLGPGSFTGLRIGLGTCKGLAMAAGIALCGVPTLDALASQVPFASELICPVLDARKKEVYTAFYRAEKETGKPLRISALRAITPEALAREIKEPVIFLGDGASVYEEILKGILGNLARFPSGAAFFPRAATIGMLALERFIKGEILNTAAAVPIYVRPSEAELHFGKS